MSLWRTIPLICVEESTTFICIGILQGAQKKKEKKRRIE
jgi:hypothetical protein